MAALDNQTEHSWTSGPWRAVVEEKQPQPLYWGIVALVQCGDGYKAVVTEDPPRMVTVLEWEANTRLMAAAPTMYSALDYLLTHSRDADCGDHCRNSCMWCAARLVLASARGEA